MFRDYLDLGEIPSHPKDFEFAKQHDEMEELEKTPQSGINYLAGAEQSWWRCAFAARFTKLEQEEKTDSERKRKKEAANKGSEENDDQSK